MRSQEVGRKVIADPDGCVQLFLSEWPVAVLAGSEDVIQFQIVRHDHSLFEVLLDHHYRIIGPMGTVGVAYMNPDSANGGFRSVTIEFANQTGLYSGTFESESFPYGNASGFWPPTYLIHRGPGLGEKVCQILPTIDLGIEKKPDCPVFYSLQNWSERCLFLDDQSTRVSTLDLSKDAEGVIDILLAEEAPLFMASLIASTVEVLRERLVMRSYNGLQDR
jgi:hypothetical protein